MDLKGLSNSLGSSVTVISQTVHISRELLRYFWFVLLCILLRLRFCLFQERCYEVVDPLLFYCSSYFVCLDCDWKLIFGRKESK